VSARLWLPGSAGSYGSSGAWVKLAVLGEAPGGRQHIGRTPLARGPYPSTRPFAGAVWERWHAELIVHMKHWVCSTAQSRYRGQIAAAVEELLDGRCVSSPWDPQLAASGRSMMAQSRSNGPTASLQQIGSSVGSHLRRQCVCAESCSRHEARLQAQAGLMPGQIWQR
jgi:hypothetical protein